MKSGAHQREPFMPLLADVDGNRIAREAGRRTCDALASMLASGTAELATEPMRLAELLHGAMTGIARRLIESPTPHKLHESYRAELIRLVTPRISMPPHARHSDIRSAGLALHREMRSSNELLPASLWAVFTFLPRVANAMSWKRRVFHASTTPRSQI